MYIGIQSSYCSTKKYSMLNDAQVFSSFSTDKVETVKDFYSSVLQLKTKVNAMGILELHLEGAMSVIIYPKPNHVPATFTVLNFEVKDIEETVDQLSAAGVIFEQYEG